MKRIFNSEPNSGYRQWLLAIYFFIATTIPNFILAHTEPYSIWSTTALILLPLSFYMMWSVILRRSGVMIILCFPFIFLDAFQIILLYLFGNSIIATDMFTNLLTTTPREAGELLVNIYPAIIVVCALYLPLLWLAIVDITKKRLISRTARIIVGLTGAILMSVGVLTLIPAHTSSNDKYLIFKVIFPINVMYNITFSLNEFRKINNFEETSANFSYNATRPQATDQKEIYVYIIGETARAMNWQLYGYHRDTNPLLSKIENVNLFYNVITQSNTTHKSVPLLLSSIATGEHEKIYKRSGLHDLFNEVGFETWFISNQTQHGAMIDNLTQGANHTIYIDPPNYDMEIYEHMRKAVESSKSEKILFVLHCYGSHFSYTKRYPTAFSKFTPDSETLIKTENREQILNAYDNSILYADYYLSNTIKYLKSLNICSALLYCSDHGEDIMDDDRNRFLHSSPTTTAYQLHVPCVVWFSDEYNALHPKIAVSAEQNRDAPATTHSMFHTIAEIASIESKYIKADVSLVNDEFNYEAKRHYLSDHNKAISLTETGLNDNDIQILNDSGIKF